MKKFLRLSFSFCLLLEFSYLTLIGNNLIVKFSFLTFSEMILGHTNIS